MTQRPSEPLDYRTLASDAPVRHRQKACRHALGNGIASVAIGLLFGASVASFFGPLVVRGPVTALLLLKFATFSLNALGYFVCGFFYIVASRMIRQRNVFWEKTLLLAGATHLVVVITITLVLLMKLQYYFYASDLHFGAAWDLNLFFNLGAILVLGHMLVLAIYTRWHCS